MQITYDSTDVVPVVRFKDLDTGECFKYEGDLYMKGKDTKSHLVAIRLVSGNCYDFLPNTSVKPINAHVRVVRNECQK